MSKPKDISPEAFKAAWACAEVVLRNLPDDYGDVSLEVKTIARAMDAAKAEEREACAQVAVDHAAGRLRQSLAAKEAKKPFEARDFESMSMSATDVAFAIRKRGEA